MTAIEALQELISTSPMAKEDMGKLERQVKDLIFQEIEDEIERIETEFINDSLFIQMNQE